jgi:hypothetical protein
LTDKGESNLIEGRGEAALIGVDDEEEGFLSEIDDAFLVDDEEGRCEKIGAELLLFDLRSNKRGFN